MLELQLQSQFLNNLTQLLSMIIIQLAVHQHLLHKPLHQPKHPQQPLHLQLQILHPLHKQETGQLPPLWLNLLLIKMVCHFKVLLDLVQITELLNLMQKQLFNLRVNLNRLFQLKLQHLPLLALALHQLNLHLHPQNNLSLKFILAHMKKSKSLISAESSQTDYYNQREIFPIII